MTTTTIERPLVRAPGTGHLNVGRLVGTTGKYVFAVVSALAVLLPMYVLVVTSFKDPSDVSVRTMWSLPDPFVPGAWARAWVELAPSMTRTLVLAVASAIIASMLGALNGYVLSLVKVRFMNLIFGMILFGMFIPYQAIMLPLREVIKVLHLPGGVITLIVAHSIYGIPITTLIFRNFFLNTIPPSIAEAAHVDGASVWRTFTSIVLPLAGPAFAVTIIWQFTMVWNDFLFAIFLTNTRNGPVMLALNALAGAQSPDYAQSMAGALIACAAPALVYVLLGRLFVSGLLAGSLKG